MLYNTNQSYWHMLLHEHTSSHGAVFVGRDYELCTARHQHSALPSAAVTTTEPYCDRNHTGIKRVNFAQVGNFYPHWLDFMYKHGFNFCKCSIFPCFNYYFQKIRIFRGFLNKFPLIAWKIRRSTAFSVNLATLLYTARNGAFSSVWTLARMSLSPCRPKFYLMQCYGKRALAFTLDASVRFAPIRLSCAAFPLIRPILTFLWPFRKWVWI